MRNDLEHVALHQHRGENLTSKNKPDIKMKVILHDGHAYTERKGTHTQISIH